MTTPGKKTLSGFNSSFYSAEVITERLLQFIWQFQYFNQNELATTQGEPLQILHPGNHNLNQGPDFQNAKIKIQNTTWAGNIEVHLKTSDWNRHRHSADKNYDTVILHVVWENDRSETPAPVLELKTRVPGLLLKRYEELMKSAAFIPCEKSISSVKDIIWKTWKERLLAERLMRKTKTVEKYLSENNHHWEETLWWMLAKNFGIKVNTDAFGAIARSVPVNILSKHKNQIHQLEALLLGQARLLEGKFSDAYAKLLQKEYRFLKEKYRLQPIHQPVLFLRMRPGHFPTVRLAQLAMLVSRSTHLFSKIKEATTAEEVVEWFDITASKYWHCHYRFDETSPPKKKKLGKTMIDNIIINTICPVLFAYGQYHGEQSCKDKAIGWLQKIKAENNAITRGFLNAGMKSKNAFDSQAMIELKNEYCNNKKCLSCGVGNAILKG